MEGIYFSHRLIWSMKNEKSTLMSETEIYKTSHRNYIGINLRGKACFNRMNIYIPIKLVWNIGDGLYGMVHW